MARKTLIARFWEKVNTTGDCWEWQAHRIKRGGYGRFHVNGRDLMAHRMAYELTTGRAIPAGMHVLHRCDNPPCVRFEHLFLGTNQDNVEDRQTKGRSRGQRIGNAPRNAKLTAEQVAEIRRRYAEGGVLQRELVNEFGIGKVHMSEIINGHHWSDEGRQRRRERTNKKKAAGQDGGS